MDFQYYKDLIDFASENSKMLDIFQFVERVHTLSDCKKDECGIGTYLACLKGVLLYPEKSYED